jgi:hypothetical protein
MELLALGLTLMLSYRTCFSVTRRPDMRAVSLPGIYSSTVVAGVSKRQRRRALVVSPCFVPFVPVCIGGEMRDMENWRSTSHSCHGLYHLWILGPEPLDLEVGIAKVCKGSCRRSYGALTSSVWLHALFLHLCWNHQYYSSTASVWLHLCWNHQYSYGPESR